MSLLIEALVVGIMTAILGFIISTLFMMLNKDFSFKKYSFWWQVLGSFFVTGVIIHLVCDGTGINKWYCKNGNACK